MSGERPPLNDTAKETLEQYQQKVRNTITNLAEKKVLDDGRSEVGEEDIIRAQKSVAIRSHNTARKWSIRILILASFAFLAIQIGAIFQLYQFVSPQTLPFAVQLCLAGPTFVILILFILFTLVFKEDWL